MMIATFLCGHPNIVLTSKPSSVLTHLVLLHCVVSSRHEASAHGGAVTGRCWSCAVCTVPCGTFNVPWGPSCGLNNAGSATTMSTTGMRC